ncbi:MAG TPA: ABC transporter ATP-binding protein [Gemmatimonadaceae bacterium]|nr:ABC transporter ATP-binding protein [Gemmatimonadaceae bacterium]
MRAMLALPLELVRHEPKLLARFTLASIGRAALAAATILLIREFLSGVLGQSGGLAGGVADRFGPEGALWAVAALLLLAHLGATLLTYDTRVSQQRIVKVVELGTMDRLIRHLLSLSVSFFDERTHGDLIQTVRQDVSHLRTSAMAAATIVLESIQALFLIAVAIVLSPSLAVWAFVLVPLSALPIYIIARRTLASAFGVRRKGVMLFDVLLQLLRGMRIIKIYQGEEVEADRTVERARHYFDELIAMERVRAMARVVLESLGGLSLVIVIIVGGWKVLDGSLGWPALLAFLMAVRASQGPLNNVNTSYMEIQRHGASVAHISALLAERPAVVDHPQARPVPRPPARLSVHDLSFARRGVHVLHGISFEVRAGETLGVVGPSGAGKSTLLDLLARFSDPTGGCVRLDGTDLREVSLRELYCAIAIVTQDPFLFSATILENIRVGRPDATDREVEAAASTAEIHGDILAMPDGYLTLVGQGGRSLSRGEAQRVNIARAVLKNAPILLLDEATSSLDSHAELRVQRAIDRLVAGRLVITVAHRLSTLRNADRILVLSEGRAVGLGTHAELLTRCEAYRKLWEAQNDVPSAVPLPRRHAEAS